MPLNSQQQCNSQSPPISCTSNCTVQSSTDSNDIEECISNFEASRMAMGGKFEWTPEMDEHFIDAYIAFKLSKKWDKRKSLEWNYGQIAEHLRENHGDEVSAAQCQSRFYRFKKKWQLFCQLRGLSNKAATGIGWEEDTQHFTADKDHWADLISSNSEYEDFSKPFSCGLYERFTPIMIGETATGTRAQSASQPEISLEQLGNEQTTSRRSRKGKAKASVSSQPPSATSPWEGEDVYYVSPIPGGTSGKRPASSLGNSGEREGSRGTKSTRSSADRLEDALSKIGNFTDVARTDRKDRIDRDETYKVENCQDIVSAMDIPVDWKVEIDSYLAEDENLGQRIIFMRYDAAGRYAYVARHMRKKGEA
ncbi:uncharacterized protein [Coffea arabica]|uniref:Myb/SANT-like domain-containing protein n=1 Tax=Coffea arabica TaxID=13443 RepID=A0ABM4UNF5_COFAR